MALPNDKYGRIIMIESDGITDIYTVTDDSIITFEFLSGTDLVTVYRLIESMKPSVPDLITAKTDKLAAFNVAVQQYIKDRYTTDQTLQLLNLYILSKEDGLINRTAYLRQGFIWARSIISYATTFAATVNSQKTPEAVVSMTWDINSNVCPDPLLKSGIAIQIPD